MQNRPWWPSDWSKASYCVLMVYCVLNNNTFKLFWREHIVRIRLWYPFQQDSLTCAHLYYTMIHVFNCTTMQFFLAIQVVKLKNFWNKTLLNWIEWTWPDYQILPLIRFHLKITWHYPFKEIACWHLPPTHDKHETLCNLPSRNIKYIDF